MNVIKWLLERKGLVFILLTILGSLVVLTHIYFFGFTTRLESDDLTLPKAILFLILLITLIVRVIIDSRNRKSDENSQA